MILGLLLLILLIILAVRYKASHEGVYVVDESNRIEDIVTDDFDDAPAPLSGSNTVYIFSIGLLIYTYIYIYILSFPS